jgi:hypothetical protein
LRSILSNMVKPARPVTLSTTHLSLSSVPTLARFTRVHKYNNVQCILLLFNAGNVLLCVIYQLNFIIGMYVNEKQLIYRVRYYPRFRASAVGLGTYYPRIQGDYCTLFSCILSKILMTEIYGSFRKKGQYFGR